jgi:glycerol-3-phosphate dehydrogenase
MRPDHIANIVVIGGGIIGLAVLAELAQHYEDVFLLEAAPRVGLGSSTRNSGVIHAGMYYEPGSLKAFHCVRGARMLYEFCARYNIPHQRIGKLIVADTLDQLPQLEALRQRGDTNGVEGLQIVAQDFIRQREPNLVSPVALWSPNTGIVEAEEYVKTLARLAKERGAHILTDTLLLDVQMQAELALLCTQREEFGARLVINCAGLYADEVARLFGYDKYTIHPCRGEYAELVPSKTGLVNGLIYPLPLASGHGLGVHFTKTTGGQLLIGPNSRYVTSKEDYESDRTLLEEFYASAVPMVPSLRLEDMRLSYTGLRSRLPAAHEHHFADFVIEHDPQWTNVIHLIGMESPGLTSALSVGKSVGEMVRQIKLCL